MGESLLLQVFLTICLVLCVAQFVFSLILLGRVRRVFHRYTLLLSRISGIGRELEILRLDFRNREDIRELRFGHHIDSSGVLYAGWNSGFFSNCTTLLWELAQLCESGVVPVRVAFVNGFEFYRDSNSLGIDIYNQLFQADQSVNLGGAASWPFLNHHGVYSAEPIFLYHLLARRWFTPSVKVEKISKALVKKYTIDPSNTVAVLYRGTDKGLEVQLATSEEYARLAADAISGLPDGRVLIQTDQRQVRDFFCSKFGSRCVFFNEMPVTSGATVIHNLADEALGMSRLEFAQHLLAVLLIVSKCRFVINHTGNMALWACLFRGNTEGMTQFDQFGVPV